MKKNIAVAFSLLFTSIPGFAIDGQDRGGGAAIVCRDSEQKVTRAFLYDFWEVEKENTTPTFIVRNEKSVDLQIEDVLAHLHKTESRLNGSQENVASLLRRALGLVKRDWTTIEPGQQLPLQTDIVPKKLPSGNCKLETIAIYDDKEAALSVNNEVVQKLSKTDQAGLKLHEAIYKTKRILAKDFTSEKTRKSVVRLFSGQDLTNVYGEIKVGIDETLLSLVSWEDTREEISGAKVDLIFGGKSLICSNPKDASDSVTLMMARDPEDETDRSMHLASTSFGGWYEIGIQNEMTAFRQLTEKNQYESVFKIRVGEPSGDFLNLIVDPASLLSEAAYGQSQTIQNVKFEFNPERGEVESGAYNCQLK